MDRLGGHRRELANNCARIKKNIKEQDVRLQSYYTNFEKGFLQQKLVNAKAIFFAWQIL